MALNFLRVVAGILAGTNSNNVDKDSNDGNRWEVLVVVVRNEIE